MTTVRIGNGVPVIGRGAFRALPNLTKVTFGSKVNEIQDYAFQDCVNLQNFTLPSTIQYLRFRCFAGCDKALTAVTIPTNKDELETELGQGVFSGCSKLATVTFGDTVKVLTGVNYAPGYIGSYGDHDYSTELTMDYDNALFYNCTSLKTINWGAGIKTIGDIAFLNCSALTDLVLPASITDIGNHAFFGCSSLKTVVVKGKVNFIGRYAFGNCPALHYVDFQGATMTSAPGYMPFAFDRDVVTAYAAEDSTGWTGVAEVGGLPDDGMWGGAHIKYGPPSATAGNPYDFYPVTPTDTVYYNDYEWSAPVILTTEPYENGETIPETPAEIKEGCAVYLSYAFDEYWRGEAFNVTNRFTLSGAKSGTFEYAHNWAAHETVDYGWKTNAVPELLQNLAPGDYVLTLQLNAGDRLKETDYSNNSTSIAFTVVAVPKYTVTFDMNGAGGTAPASCTVYEGKTLGKLPSPSAPAGWTFLGWFTEAQEGYVLEDDFVVDADITCFAHWSKCDIGFYTPTSEEGWESPMFVTTDYDGVAHMSSVQQGETIYLKYAFRNLAGEYDMSDFINSFKLSTGAVFADDWTGYMLDGAYFGWAEYAWEVAALQNLAPGTYTLTCTLDATGVLTEADEGNNTKSITFTVVSNDLPPTVNYTVTFNANGGSVSPATRTVESGTAVGTLPTATRSGYTLDGWFTAASGGTQISASTEVTANVTYYAHWTAEGGSGDSGSGSGSGDSGSGDSSGGDVYQSGSPMPVTYVINNYTYNITVIVGQAWGSSLPDAPTAPSGQTFVGWYTGANGTGTRVTATSIVPNKTVTLYPYFVAAELYWLCDVVDGAASATAASTYNGYMYDAKWNLKGTIQVKLGKPGKKDGKASVKATVIVGTKKVTLKAKDNGKAVIEKDGPTVIELVGGDACAVKIGTDGLFGIYGAYVIDGARDFIASKDKAEADAANAILSKWLGSVNVVWKGGSANISIAKKGKANAKGTLADGKTKVSAKSVFIIGEEWCCVPVIAPKANLAFLVWLSRDERKAAVEGLGGDVRVGAPGSLASGSTFRVSKGAALWSQISGKVLTGYLPDGMEVTPSGTKWTLPKAGKVVYKNGAVDASKLGKNPSGLKLTYKAKDGSFKGSFKVYSDNGGKLKATTVNVIGMMIKGKGYGTATVKGKGSVEISIE